MSKLTKIAVAVALAAGSGVSFADLITPSTFSATIGVGSSTSTDKTVLVSAGAPIGVHANVLFVSDTTGSMSGTINTVSSTFAATVAALSTSLGANVAYGAGQYKDMTSAGDAFDYHLDQAISHNAALTQAAIAGWSAGGGGDYPEQALYALTQASGATTGWEAGAKKIVVLTGDAPSHDTLGNPPAPAGTTVASTAAALAGASVTVLALDAGGLNDFGQFSGASSIYADGATGTYVNPFPPVGSLASALAALFGRGFVNYSDVSLQVDGLAAGLSVSLPAGWTGVGSRATDALFDLGNVTFTGTAAGTYDFTINALVDGVIVASETDSITVTNVPEPASMLLIGSAFLAMGGLRRWSGSSRTR